MHRTWGKPDANQAAIVAALLRAGVSVLKLSPLGGGCPDLLCSYRGRVTFLEVKQPGKTLRTSQASWVASWDPFANIVVVQTVTEAVDAACR
jgi:hypothetical protein